MTKDRMCIFTSIYDPGNEHWTAVKVYRDGNPLPLAHFDHKHDADDYADDMRAAYNARHSRVED
jgi:hypothetical protein